MSAVENQLRETIEIPARVTDNRQDCTIIMDTFWCHSWNFN